MTKKKGVRCSVEDCWHRAEYTCDYRISVDGFGVACNAQVCRYHAKLVRFGVHYCPKHSEGKEEKGGVENGPIGGE